MSDPTSSNPPEPAPESVSPDPAAPKPRGFKTIYGFSEETRRRLGGSTVVSVPRSLGEPVRDAQEDD